MCVPGLPPGHGNLLLGLIVRTRKYRPEVTSPQQTEKIVAEVCLKRHHSGSLDGPESRRPAKRSRITTEVGVNGETPPRLTGFQDDMGDEEEEMNQNTTPVVPVENSHYVSPTTGGGGDRESSRQRRVSSSGEMATIAGPTSFFGSHQPLMLDQDKDIIARPEKNSPASGSTEKASSTKGTLDSIFSQLSDQKLFNDLASAVSKVTNKPFRAHSSSHSGAGASSSSTTQQVPDYGANTPPPEDLELAPSFISSHERIPRVASGAPFPSRQGAASSSAPQGEALLLGGQPTSASGGASKQNQAAASQSGSQEWRRDRERFANTPPPDYQPSFNFPQQGVGGDAQAVQYQDSNSTAPVDPRSAYSSSYPQHQDQYRGEQQQRWDYSRQESHFQKGRNGSFPQEDGRFSSRERSTERGGAYRDRHDNYRQRRGRGFRHDKNFSQGSKSESKYPPEWYRK